MTSSGNGVPERLPSGRHQLEVAEVQEHQRARLIEAIAELCAERGYANVVISDIVARAAVSKSTFYRFYETKEACLFDAHKHLFAALLAAVDSASRDAASAEDRLRSAIRTALSFAAMSPRAAQLLTTGILSAGPRGAARYRTATQALAERLFDSDGARHADAFAAALFAAPAVTALAGEDDDPAALISLEDTFVEIALAYAAR
jgi:AcrR family transcriptional regulator